MFLDDDQKFKRRWPKIKLQKQSRDEFWGIHVDCGDYDTSIATSVSKRELALLHALAIAGISVEIQGAKYHFHNLEGERHLPQE